APPSGPTAGPTMTPPLLPPPISNGASPASTAAIPVPTSPTSGQSVLALSARYAKDQPNVTSGLVWRIYSDRPDVGGAFKLLREEKSATPNIVLPAGGYVVHVSLGLASAVRTVSLK